MKKTIAMLLILAGILLIAACTGPEVNKDTESTTSDGVTATSGTSSGTTTTAVYTGNPDEDENWTDNF